MNISGTTNTRPDPQSRRTLKAEAASAVESPETFSACAVASVVRATCSCVRPKLRTVDGGLEPSIDQCDLVGHPRQPDMLDLSPMTPRNDRKAVRAASS